MYQRYTTNGTPGQFHHRYWQEVIGNTYFNLQLRFPQTESFEEMLESWEIGAVSISRLQSNDCAMSDCDQIVRRKKNISWSPFQNKPV